MKALFTSDWHLDWSTAGVPRTEDIARAVDVTVKAAIKQKATHYFFLGDLCDPDRSSSVFACITLAMLAAVELRANGIESHWLAGNHDVVEDGRGTTTLTPMRALVAESVQQGASVYVHEAPAVMDLSDPSAASSHGRITLFALPFTSLSHAYDPHTYADAAIRDAGRLLVISHLSVAGVVPGEETHEMPRGRDVSFPASVLAKRPPGTTAMFQGHYHRRQDHETAAGTLHIVGSLARLTFGEENHEPAYSVLSW